MENDKNRIDEDYENMMANMYMEERQRRQKSQRNNVLTSLLASGASIVSVNKAFGDPVFDM